MKTVHLIFNAHLDPIWLWPWQSGLDELLNTCRTACDLLEKHPDLIFSRGEAWIYRQIERINPSLFSRIQRLVKQGRWEIVGGWWIQPDCNQPSGFAMERQIAMGKEYFISRFGFFPDIAYNVDSFGHAATLPGYMAAAGQKYYVMMRPPPVDKPLPARVFRWRGYEGGPEVLTFRIANAYLANPITLEHIENSLTEMPAGCEQTMCFVGLGDHGGGPTEELIEWCRENQDAIPGVRSVISSPSRFFKALEEARLKLPRVTGDLQPHAVGCYSIYRPVKLAVRQAEYRLAQAEILRNKLGAAADKLPALQRGWENVCFHHFHDTLGGTCTPSAYPQVLAQLGEALSLADENLQVGLRLMVENLPAAPHQRIIAYNPSHVDFEGFVEHELWLDRLSWDDGSIHDERGRRIPEQSVHSEALSEGIPRLLFPVKIAAGGVRILSLRRGAKKSPAPVKTTVRKRAISNDIGIGVTGGVLPRISFARADITLTPQIELIDDPSDTWSHDINRYNGPVVARARWHTPQILDSGPLMASLFLRSEVSRSRLTAEYRVYAGKPWIELRLGVNWQETHKVLKLTFRAKAFGERRIDGILGGSLVRESTGAELPVQNWTLLTFEGGAKLGIVCPDVFALDATRKEVRLTLLRSAMLANHDPHPATYPRGTVADQGMHEFRFRIWAGDQVTPAALEKESVQIQAPPLFADATKGMPCRWSEMK